MNQNENSKSIKEPLDAEKKESSNESSQDLVENNFELESKLFPADKSASKNSSVSPGDKEVNPKCKNFFYNDECWNSFSLAQKEFSKKDSGFNKHFYTNRDGLILKKKIFLFTSIIKKGLYLFLLIFGFYIGILYPYLISDTAEKNQNSLKQHGLTIEHEFNYFMDSPKCIDSNLSDKKDLLVTKDQTDTKVSLDILDKNSKSENNSEDSQLDIIPGNQ